MTDSIEAVYELARSAAAVRFRILRTDGEEHPDSSWQRVTCHLHREDVAWGAIPLVYAIAALSFGDARPRGKSGIEYRQEDEWRIADMVQRLRFERGALEFEGDYVRGRMMKTTVTVETHGHVVVETRNRHEMAVRWLRALKGKKHLQLAETAPRSEKRGE